MFSLIKYTIPIGISFCIFACSQLYAGTTGKISGKIIDAKTNDGLLGVNVLIQGTRLGATSDPDGYYFISNLIPGTYTLVVSMIGYNKTVISNVVVKIDLTTAIDVKMKESIVEGEEVVIRAERPLVQKDLTSTSVTVSADEIKAIPVENVGQIVNLQAGVVGGHFRGGRAGEVSYLIDGISVLDPFNSSLSVQIENSSIREMEVISGTFNAEYGQAMSGVVNIVTQDGGKDFHGMISGYVGDYVTTHTDTYLNLGKVQLSRMKDVQATLSGPSYVDDRLSFFFTGRYYDDEGYLYGKRVYNTWDIAPTYPDTLDRNRYVNHYSGDGVYVPMNPSSKYSLNGKFTYAFSDIKFSYSIFYDENKAKYYDHSFSRTPDGISNHFHLSTVHIVQASHVLSNSTFQTVKYSSNYFTYHGGVYSNPYDARYVNPTQGTPPSNYTFRAGGNQTGRYERNTKSSIVQWALSSQLSKEHKLGIGAEVRWHTLYNHDYSVVNMTEGIPDTVILDGEKIISSKFTLGYRDLGTPGNQSYEKKPFEFSAYVQDKMEYDIMIINAGLRFDYFRSNGKILADLKNPEREKDSPDSTLAGVMNNAATKIQVSPRLGVSFPITDQGIVHFSYGHFFQIPNFDNLFTNSEYLVPASGSVASVTGNPDLKAERTVMYEVGLQQALTSEIGFDFTLYYRNIRNLLGMEIIKTNQGTRYARFINRDYGNVRGFILSFDKRFANYFSASMDYTYQIAEGNASDPYQVYYNSQTDPPIETNKKVVPLDWDQASTLNVSMTVGELDNWTTGLIFQYGSGFPYTEDMRTSQGLRFENGGVKPSTFNVDLRAEKKIDLDPLKLNLFCIVYNVFDVKNELGVYASTGRSNRDLYSKNASPIIGLNTLQEYMNDPTSYSAPRQIRLGCSLEF